MKVETGQHNRLDRADVTLLNWQGAVLPAPYFRKTFSCDANND